MSLEAGSRIAQYRLERKIGAGGMGEVYLAHDENLDRFVAIKLLTATDEAARRRLVREARAAARLDHPNICAVFEVGSDPTAGDFIAMQYIEGDTLAVRLRRGKLNPDEAMSIGAQIAEALVAAHRHGLVHRDLKPQNIVVTPTGVARLLDFGLAQHVAKTHEAANVVTASRVTDPDVVLGTPGYMSPEQVRNEVADFRTDVFALGCVLYECLTGRRAFTGATTAEVLGAILHVDPPPVSTVVPNVGPAYDALCARLLEKNPSERFHSAEEALGAIRALTPSAHFSTKSLKIAPPRRTRRIWQIAAIAAVVAAVAYGWNVSRGPALPDPPAEALRWYNDGVEALRDGAFLGARTAFEQAIQSFRGYTQAYSRLAEANTALDDEEAARVTLLEISGISQARWPKDEQLRFDAAKAASLRHYAEAIAKYRELMQLSPNDAGRWLDLGRALENSPVTPRSEAIAAYQKAVDLDGQFAAARLRLGVMLARAGRSEEGIASIDQAIALYQKRQRTEGEIEARLRKAIALASSRQRIDEAREGFEEVTRRSADARLPSQNIRAQFGIAQLQYDAGLWSEAERTARQALSAAANANLHALSASALIELNSALAAQSRYQEADDLLGEAIDIARTRGATRVEMRAKLYRAGLKLRMAKPAEGVALASEAVKYFGSTEETRLLSDSKNQLIRAYEQTERYGEALTMVQAELQFAEKSNDNAARANAYEGMAGVLRAMGNLPEALKYRQRLLILDKNVPNALALHLTNTADLLVRLGRASEAEELFREVDRGIAAKVQAYLGRRARMAQIRALNAVIDRRWPDAIREAKNAEGFSTPPKPGEKLPDVVLLSRILAEYAKAQLGTSQTSLPTISSWPLLTVDGGDRREWTFWVALTLLLRGDAAGARALTVAALATPGVQENIEQGWRLAAVAAMANKQQPSADVAAALSRKNVTPEELEKAWGEAAKLYFARPDLTALRKGVR